MPEAASPAGSTAQESFDPGAYTVAEVQSYVLDHPERAQAVRDAEAAGKNRSTLLVWLDQELAR